MNDNRPSVRSTPQALKAFILLVIIMCVCVACTDNSKARANGFDQIFKLKGISFHVVCPNSSSLNKLTIVPAGLKDNHPIIVPEIDGTVTGAEVADLNKDESPEIYIFITSAGSGSYGSLVAYGANDNKLLSEIYLPPLEDDKINSKGYMGHDSFAVKGNRLSRSFPFYLEGDTNADPTGGVRDLQYKLIAGENGWILQLMDCN
jgi:hypothetical protein